MLPPHCAETHCRAGPDNAVVRAADLAVGSGDSQPFRGKFMKTRKIAALAGAAGLALLGASIPGHAAAAPGPSPKLQVVELRDDCEQASFNAAGLPCGPGGGTTFAEFLDALPDGGDNHWKFTPDKVTLPAGSRLQAHNRGPEPHTFTWVKAFGPGCVGLINGRLGLNGEPAKSATPIPSCPPAAIAPGDTGTAITFTKADTYRFQCMIHPWMRTTVTVEASNGG
jgi:plastocyanin